MTPPKFRIDPNSGALIFSSSKDPQECNKQLPLEGLLKNTTEIMSEMSEKITQLDNKISVLITLLQGKGGIDI